MRHNRPSNTACLRSRAYCLVSSTQNPALRKISPKFVVISSPWVRPNLALLVGMKNPNGTFHTALVLLTLVSMMAGCKGIDLSAGSSTCTRSGNPISFTEPVTDIESLKFVTPLPALAGGAVFEGRSYMSVKDEYYGIRVPVRAPTRMTLRGYSYYRLPDALPGYKPEWSLAFDVECGDVQVMFAHIKELVPTILEVVDQTPSPSSATRPVSRDIEFAAGETIGYYIKGENSNAWDFLVTDRRRENQFANQARYRENDDKLLHVVCPYEFYTPELQRKFLDLLANFSGIHLEGMQCGTVVHDVPGTLAGAWFPDQDYRAGSDGGSAEGQYGPLVSIFKSESKVIYVGGIGIHRLEFHPGSGLDVDPKTVSTEHCYGGSAPGMSLPGFVYFQLQSANELRVFYSSEGFCPTEFPTTGFRTYYR